ncbi:MAG: amino acid deaminase/aldolase [Mycobacteriaceae bacterium]
MNTALDRIRTATSKLQAPLLALDLTTLQTNAGDLTRRAGGTPIRIASKSVRCREVLEIILGSQLTENQGFRGIMAYSLEEAIWLANKGAQDILLGYPTVNTPAIKQLSGNARLLGSITFMADHTDQLKLIRAALKPTDQPRVCFDIDASLRIGPAHLGVRRSPLRTPEQVTKLAQSAITLGFNVVGVMFYEAQIAGLQDNNVAIRLMKRLSAKELSTRRSQIVQAVRDICPNITLVNSGGSGSLEVSSADPCVTEVTAGSGLYVTTLFDHYRSFTPHPALYFALPSVRKPTKKITTLFGGGYPASGAAGPSRLPTPVWPSGSKLLKNEGAGEVQTPITADLPIGDLAWFRPTKAGETCERFNNIHLVHPDGSYTTVPTYRGEGFCF